MKQDAQGSIPFFNPLGSDAEKRLTGLHGWLTMEQIEGDVLVYGTLQHAACRVSTFYGADARFTSAER